MEQGISYVEGRIDMADSPGNKRPQRTEAEAQAACTADETCLGIWNQNTGNWILLWGGGSRAWSAGVPNGTVKSVKVKTRTEDEAAAEGDPPLSLANGNKRDLESSDMQSAALLEETDELQACTYTEGRIAGGDSPANKRPQRSESEAQAACSVDETCLGIWNQHTGNWILLWTGSRAWSAGVPNWTVKSVKVKACTEDEAAAEGDPHMSMANGHKRDLEPEDLQPPALLEEAEMEQGISYVEGRIDMADSPGNKRPQRTEAEAQAACTADETCLGIWNQNTGNWILLWGGGSRAWSAGVPNGTVKSVNVKTRTEDEAAAEGDPHLSLANGNKRDLESSDLQSAALLEETDELQACTYTEGRIAGGDSPANKRPQRSESE